VCACAVWVLARGRGSLQPTSSHDTGDGVVAPARHLVFESVFGCMWSCLRTLHGCVSFCSCGWPSPPPSSLQAKATIGKEAVPVVAPASPVARPPPSLLSQELKRTSAGGSSARPAMRLTLHLPTAGRGAFHVSVPVTATVEDVLQCVMRAHKREEGHGKPLPTYESRCYELRLPDSDDPTVPDEDIPGAWWGGQPPSRLWDAGGVRTCALGC
jgi:hypothetical protein